LLERGKLFGCIEPNIYGHFVCISRIGVAEQNECAEASVSEKLSQILFIKEAFVELFKPRDSSLLWITMGVTIDVVKIEHGSHSSWPSLNIELGNVSEVGNSNIAADSIVLK
jgi:hypothetical protein